MPVLLLEEMNALAARREMSLTELLQAFCWKGLALARPQKKPHAHYPKRRQAAA